jgi:hypothetical protein
MTPHWAVLYAWLIAGLVGLGLGAALLAGTAVATADTGSSSTGGSTSTSGKATSSKHGVASSRRAPVAAKIAPARADATNRSTRTSRATPTAPVTAAAPTPTLNPVQAFMRQLNYIFANKPPSIESGTQTSGAGGTVSGTVIGKSNNGFTLKYSIGDQPTNGSVVLDPVTGAYTYTPNTTLPSGAIMDEFTIVADNGSAAKLHGPLGAVQNALRSIAVQLGASGITTADAAIYVDLDNPAVPTIIGNPDVTKQYWVTDGRQTSGLAAVVMAVGQLTGTMPNIADWIAKAKITDSVERQLFVNGPPTGQYRKMYLDDGTDWVWTGDALELLSTSGNGINVSTTYFPKTKADVALTSMASALTAGSVVLVSINAPILGYTNPVNHLVVVLGMNTETDQIFVNDAAWGADGQNRAMSLTDFMKAWEPNYPLGIATRPLAAAAGQPLTQADLALAA